MKLHCTSHKRRVQVLETAKVLHRSDGSECLSPTVKIGKVMLTPLGVVTGDHQNQGGME